MPFSSLPAPQPSPLFFTQQIHLTHMINERWITAAITSDALVAEILLRLKRSSSSDSPPLLSPAAAAPVSLNPPGWGDRKSRSKATVIVAKGQQRSPSSPLSWNGGGEPEIDGYDESMSNRCSDLYSGDRSVKGDLHENSGKELETRSEIEMMKRRRCMLPDLNETPALAFE